MRSYWHVQGAIAGSRGAIVVPAVAVCEVSDRTDLGIEGIVLGAIANNFISWHFYNWSSSKSYSAWEPTQNQITVSSSYLTDSTIIFVDACRIDRQLWMDFLESQAGITWICFELPICFASLLLNRFWEISKHFPKTSSGTRLHKVSGSNS